MGQMEIPLSQKSEDHRRMSLDLRKRLLATIEAWGNAQGQKDVKQMHDITMDALLRTIVAICVYTELSSSGIGAESLQAAFRKVHRESPVEDGEEPLIPLRARKDVLFRNLEKTVRAF